MKRIGLEKLAGLTEAQKARDIAKVESLLTEQRKLEAEIAELAGTEARDAAEGSMPFAMIARRELWSAAQIAHRERRIAAIEIELAGARAAARISVGKHEALKKLAADAMREARVARDRADEVATLAARRRQGGR